MSIDNTLAERGARYGDFTDHAAICDAFINVAMGAGNPSGAVATNFVTLDPVKRQAIRVICDKLARILSPDGDPEYRDNWHDIQGYAKLAEDRCRVQDPDQLDLSLAVEDEPTGVYSGFDKALHVQDADGYAWAHPPQRPISQTDPTLDKFLKDRADEHATKYAVDPRHEKPKTAIQQIRDEISAKEFAAAGFKVPAGHPEEGVVTNVPVRNTLELRPEDATVDQSTPCLVSGDCPLHGLYVVPASQPQMCPTCLVKLNATAPATFSLTDAVAAKNALEQQRRGIAAHVPEFLAKQTNGEDDLD